MRAVLLAVSLSLSACLVTPTITANAPEAVAMETRHYTQPPAQVQQGTVTALKALGYEVIRNDPGRVRTAPKVALVTAYGTSYSARAVETSVAWDIRVEGEGAGATVVARPRGYAGGQAAAEDVAWNKQWFTSLLTTFYGEVDDALDTKTAPAPAAAPPEPENPKKKKGRAPS